MQRGTAVDPETATGVWDPLPHRTGAVTGLLQLSSQSEQVGFIRQFPLWIALQYEPFAIFPPLYYLSYIGLSIVPISIRYKYTLGEGLIFDPGGIVYGTGAVGAKTFPIRCYFWVEGRSTGRRYPLSGEWTCPITPLWGDVFRMD